MSLPDTATKRIGLALAGSLAVGAWTAGAWTAEAADQSLPQAVIGAFDTVVTDARTVASKATAAASEAVAPVKKTRTKKQNAAGKTDKPATNDGTAKAASDKAMPAPDKTTADDGKSSVTGVKAAADPKVDTDKTPAADDSAGKKDATLPAAPDAKDAKKPAELTEWPAADIELAKARCTQLLKGLNIVTIPEPPFRKGACGTPAPVRVVSIGKAPEVSFSPPAIMTCDLAATLVKWIETDVQPAARKHLGSEVIRLESMSDYSCRLAYGRIGNKLSEHGKANALDIGAFVTRSGKTASVLNDWGQNHRDVARQIAEAKAAREAAERAASDKAERAATTATDAAAQKDLPIPRKTIVEGLPKPDRNGSPLELPASARAGKDGLRLTPTGLGGPKTGESADAGNRNKRASDATVASLPGAEMGVAPPKPTNATSRFLHEIHDDACRIFGTTLGPEANSDHVNHFHVDMAERKIKKICD